MNTSERLQNYYSFSPETVENVAEFAEKQQGFDSYQHFLEAYDAAETKIVDFDGFKPQEVLDIRPAEHDPREAVFYHMPMANPLDPNQKYQIATIAATNPDKRIIAFGNPSGFGFNRGKLMHKDRVMASIGHSLRTVIDPLLMYADQEKIEHSHQVGYSYGADKAAETALWADHEVGALVALEPVVGKRNLAKLAIDFASSARELERYVKANDLPTFEDARKDSVGALNYNLGLLRLSNIAVARALAQGRFANRLDSAMANPNSRVTVVWGSESELATDGLVQALVGKMLRKWDRGQIQPVRLEGQKHALANDIHLQAAVVLEGLKRAA